jgi:transposase
MSASTLPPRSGPATSSKPVLRDAAGGVEGAPKPRRSSPTRATLLFLPPYSPDLNPIEMAFAKLKQLLQKVGERTRDGLWDRIGQLVDLFPPAECQNYLRQAGYEPA